MRSCCRAGLRSKRFFIDSAKKPGAASCSGVPLMVVPWTDCNSSSMAVRRGIVSYLDVFNGSECLCCVFITFSKSLILCLISFELGLLLLAECNYQARQSGCVSSYGYLGHELTVVNTATTLINQFPRKGWGKPSLAANIVIEMCDLGQYCWDNLDTA